MYVIIGITDTGTAYESGDCKGHAFNTLNKATRVAEALKAIKPNYAISVEKILQGPSPQ